MVAGLKHVGRETTANWRTSLLIIFAIILLIAEAAWIYTPLADLELTPTIRILLTVAAAIAVGLAGWWAAAHEKRMARQEAAQREALADLEEARAGLFRTIADGLDSRLSPIAQQTQRLLADPKVRATNERELSIIQYNTQRLQRFTTDVRDVIALGAGKLSLTKEPTDLRDVITSAVEANQSLARYHEVQLRMTCEASLPVRGDATRLTQILHDMLRNAFNFTPRGGLVHVIGGVNEDNARIAVQDNGRGLTPDEIPLLFRPFTRAHAPGESREVGTGLGLFIAKSILEAHDGTMWAESRGRGQGASFTIEIPLHARPFDIRNAQRPPSGAPQMPPAMAPPGAPGIR